jgi:hypothetical protein
MVDASERELEARCVGSMIAVVLVAAVATALAILPAAIALHAPGVPPAWVAGGVGMVAAVITMGKLAVMAWGACSSLSDSHRASVAAAYAD